jgi:acyl-CoA synthetase (AMP-forming)/AMP-acid ligase II/NADP-dependent 3-hydroxy acid dehydrogenase YdfG/acyl carrier protein
MSRASGSDAPIGAPAQVELEAALLAHSAVVDCVVRVRRVGGQEVTLAYVIAAHSCTADQLEAHVKSLRPGAPPIEMVFLSSLPLTNTGEPDEACLNAIDVADEPTARAWASALEQLPSVTRAIVTARDEITAPPAIHLLDVLPDMVVGATPEPSPAASATRRTTDAFSASAATRSEVRGPALLIDHAGPLTLLASLERAAREQGANTLTYLRADGSTRVQSYAELLEDALRIASGLRAMGVQPLDKVLFQFDQHEHWVAGFWGCVAAGAIPVPLPAAAAYRADDSAAAKLVNAWQMFDQPLVLTMSARLPAVRAMFAALAHGAIRVAALDALRDSDAVDRAYAADPGELALVMLTSGSTGAPKGVMLSHRNLLGMAAGVQQRFGCVPTDVTLNWMPMDHVAGLVMSHQRDVFFACRQVHAATELVLQRPISWLDLLDRYRVTITFAPNFAYGLVNECAGAIAAGRWDLSSVRIIFNGGEAVVARTARRFVTLLAPHGLAAKAMCPAWGMSETSSGVVFSSAFTLETTSDDDPFVEVGGPIGGFAMRIVDNDGCVLEQGVIGHLQVSGPSVTRGYYQRPDLDAQVFTDDGWFRTGDLAIVREQRLAITGRAKDDININGVKYFSHEIEGVVDAVPGVAVSFTAASAVRRPRADSEELAVFCVPNVSDERRIAALVGEVRHAVVARVGIAPSFVIPVTREEIPKTSLGKIQRTALRQRFEEGGFATHLKRVDIITGSASTVPSWFFRPAWRCKQIARSALRVDRRATLVFADETIAPTLLSLLAARRCRAVVVRAGAAFEGATDRGFAIRVDQADDYRRLTDVLRSESVEIGSVVHLWGCGASGPAVDERARSLLSVLAAANALSAGASSADVRLLVAATSAQGVDEEDDVEVERSGVLGLLRAIPHEMPGLSARHVDLTGMASAAAATALVDELLDVAVEPEVAYRDGARRVMRLERLPLPESLTRDVPFKTGGTYLITGGLGGVGVEIATFLLKKYAARVLAIGRTANAGDGPGGSERLHAFDALSAAAASTEGAAFRYQAADITDPDSVRRAVEDASARWGSRLDGVLHLAGVFRDRLLAEETAATVDEAFLPKVDGLAVAAGLLESPDQLLVAFSSATGYFGRFSGGAYAAASRAADALVRRVARRGPQAFSIAWSEWEGLGMMRGWVATHSRAQGYAPISRLQGIHSMLVSMRQDRPVVLAGIDGEAPAVRPYLLDEGRSVRRLTALVEAHDDIGAESIAAVRVADTFGTPSHCEIVCVPRLPDGGEQPADVEARHDPRVNPDAAPSTELERQIAKVWQEVLGVDKVSVESTFFDVGGSSLLMARVYGRLKSELAREISMTEMFRYPTIAALASHLGGTERAAAFAEQITVDRERGRDRRQRALQARRGRVRGDDGQGAPAN